MGKYNCLEETCSQTLNRYSTYNCGAPTLWLWPTKRLVLSFSCKYSVQIEALVFMAIKIFVLPPTLLNSYIQCYLFVVTICVRECCVFCVLCNWFRNGMQIKPSS